MRLWALWGWVGEGLDRDRGCVCVETAMRFDHGLVGRGCVCSSSDAPRSRPRGEGVDSGEGCDGALVPVQGGEWGPASSPQSRRDRDEGCEGAPVPTEGLRGVHIPTRGEWDCKGIPVPIELGEGGWLREASALVPMRGDGGCEAPQSRREGGGMQEGAPIPRNFGLERGRGAARAPQPRWRARGGGGGPARTPLSGRGRGRGRGRRVPTEWGEVPPGGGAGRGCNGAPVPAGRAYEDAPVRAGEEEGGGESRWGGGRSRRAREGGAGRGLRGRPSPGGGGGGACEGAPVPTGGEGKVDGAARAPSPDRGRGLREAPQSRRRRGRGCEGRPSPGEGEGCEWRPSPGAGGEAGEGKGLRVAPQS